jgi:hypothetical protein
LQAKSKGKMLQGTYMYNYDGRGSFAWVIMGDTTAYPQARGSHPQEPKVWKYIQPTRPEAAGCLAIWDVAGSVKHKRVGLNQIQMV